MRAMLDRGLTEDGAAQALGWPKARVTARVKLLELPELAQQMIGDGRVALSSVEQLRAIGAVSPELLDALVAYLADGNEWAAERLTREPGWVLDSALRSGNSKVFAAHLGGRVDSHEIAELRLGKKAEAAYERAGELTRALDRYAYHVDVRFDDSDVDQARAAGVVIEFERSAPIIVDRSLYRELVKAAITRTVAELEAKVAAREQERKTARQSQKSSGRAGGPGRGGRARAPQPDARALRPGARRQPRRRRRAAQRPVDRRPGRRQRRAGSSSTAFWAPTTTTRPTPSRASGSRGWPCRGSGS